MSPTATARACAQCGSMYSPVRRDQRFCSKRCNKTAHRDGSTECSVDDCSKPTRAKGMCVTHYNRTFHPDSHQQFPGDPAVRRRHLRTKTQRRRAASRDPGAERIDRDVVGVRDGWRCGICGKRVNRLLAYPDPMGPSLDHIEPLSLGGLHVYSNVRISHLNCNVRRGNQIVADQLLLFG
jgi:hypothetical protein